MFSIADVEHVTQTLSYCRSELGGTPRVLQYIRY